MKASETNLNRFLAQTDTQFIIPVYQRNYDWNLVQCRELFDDIIRVGSDEKQTSHFVGSIVYIHDNVYSVAGIRELSIIDGQQRLSTITLIYIALFILAKETGNEALVNRIQETYPGLLQSRKKENRTLKKTLDSCKNFISDNQFDQKATLFNRQSGEINFAGTLESWLKICSLTLQ